MALWGVFAGFAGPGLGAEEKTLILGAAAGWKAVESRTQVEELEGLRPRGVLALSSAWTGTLAEGAEPRAAGDTRETLALYAAYRNFPVPESALDLVLSFDEGGAALFADSAGHYRISVNAGVQRVGDRWARYGQGAAVFAGTQNDQRDPLVIRPGPAALFNPGRNIRDFTLEFWLYPANMENGERILSWSAMDNQRIFCEAARNKIRWTFQEFFSPPEFRGADRRSAGMGAAGPDAAGTGRRRLTVFLESRSSLVPRTWSHHMIRYNADTGLLEYLINGRIENMIHTTPSHGEGGDVYTPQVNRDGSFILGGRFSGMIDEFRVYNRFINAPGRAALEPVSRTALELPELAKFPRSGGRIESRVLDLGETGSTVFRLEASGGRFSSLREAGTRRMTVRNIYAGRGNFRFPDDSALRFFIRVGEEPYRFSQSPWIPVIPGEPIPVGSRGRFVQVAAAFYPSGDQETSPYLEELRIVYDRNEPPYPPSLVIAQALDGAVELSWRASPDEDTLGYLVYYGTSSGVYYGQASLTGQLGGARDSPIDAGNRTSLRIGGLKNGTLYFFAVAAYDRVGTRAEELHPGAFSREITARPLRGESRMARVDQ
ncbi:MAG: hypothetical protein LBG84_10600 [Treponema sp.]|nr:hypothetical protein [Treponema sp.]